MQRVEHFFTLAESIYNIELKRPSINFDLKGGSAGVATPSLNKLGFNEVLLTDNEADFMSDTIPHEVAHLVCHALHGWIKTTQGGVSHHGKEWKAIMLAFGCVPSRCHTLDVSKVKRKMRSFSYFCPDCRACFTLTAIRHNRMVRGTKSYSHKSCKTPIEFIEEIK